MHVTLPVVLSADGKMTKGDNGAAHTWASVEDAAQFAALRARHRLLVMGRHTFETVRPVPDADHLRVVLTSRPHEFEQHAIPGQLEFMDAGPAALVAAMERRGYDTMLLLGGRQVHSDFLAAKLVHELILTIEPVLFGKGLSLLQAQHLIDTPLRLQGVRQLNARGTLLLQYEVLDGTPANG